MNSSILIVDDEPQNLAAMRQILSDDYSLVFARNGSEALTAAIKHQPALILLDIQMPGMDGYAVCTALKSSPHTEAIPVIFVTSLSEVGNEAAGFAVGAVDYIVKPVYPEIVQARVRAHLSLVRVSRLENSYRDAISMLGAAGHYNDSDTGLHIWRMASYAKALAKSLGWDRDQCRLLEMAAAMHDTGKIGIPNAILRKPGKLTAQEWDVMKTHSQIGHDILSRSDAPLFRMAAEIALYHHERWDGSGYPTGLVGLAIPETARIVALADVYDAMSMDRPYKKAWPVERVVATILEGSGTHFEPRLVNTFMSIVPQFEQIKEQWQEREQINAPASSSP
jgi:putative two-component system response regulator